MAILYIFIAIVCILIISLTIGQIQYNSNKKRESIHDELHKKTPEQIEEEQRQREARRNSYKTLMAEYNVRVMENPSTKLLYLSAYEDINVRGCFKNIVFTTDENSDYYIENLKIYDRDNQLLLVMNYLTEWTKSYDIRSIYNFSFTDPGTKNISFKDNDADLSKSKAENFLYCFIENLRIRNKEEIIKNILTEGVLLAPNLNSNKSNRAEFATEILEASDYHNLFSKEIHSEYNSGMLLITYLLPNKDDLLTYKNFRFLTSLNQITTKEYSSSEKSKMYEQALYSICLRSIYEIFDCDDSGEITGITFNGFVNSIDPATGLMTNKCILSVQTSKETFLNINLLQVEPKTCFKGLKGVSASKLIDITPVTPVLTFDKNDSRFISSKDVQLTTETNLAAMNWEDFEQLVRGLFEKEFSANGSEVRVTQASRDGGVDAVVFDPDPLRGGKIIVQAKRYTNTVPVSAVRDLYGTLINEGANSGILITTSDYGSDSYEFAKGKPIKLLNGGHLLAMLQKHGKNGYINIQEAKKIIKAQSEY